MTVPQEKIIHRDRTSIAYQANAEYTGLTGMPGHERASFEAPSAVLIQLDAGEPVVLLEPVAQEK